MKRPVRPSLVIIEAMFVLPAFAMATAIIIGLTTGWSNQGQTASFVMAVFLLIAYVAILVKRGGTDHEWRKRQPRGK